MIIAQEREFLKAQEQLQALERYVQQAATEECRIHQVERELFRRLLVLGLSLLKAFVAAQGNGVRVPSWKPPRVTPCAD